jgi:predicted dithiol-disulfide oxidoreductase (DUF899 family)
METATTDIDALSTEISRLEQEVMDAKERLTAAKRKLPPEPVADYTLRNPDGSEVRLSELFGDKQDLILIHNMGKGCNYCTLWADGFNSSVTHLENRAAFVLTSPNDPATLREFAASRGWKFKTASVKESSIVKDMGFLTDKGYWPGVSTFRKHENGSITRVGKAIFGPGDDFCAVWPFFDLLEGGAGDWEPKLSY